MRAKKVCEKVDMRVRPEAETLVRQAQAIAKKLEEARKQLPAEDLIIEYDNGGGQSGVRENPFYPAYEKLLASYVKTLAAVRDMLGDHAQAEVKSLDSLRSKFKVAK